MDTKHYIETLKSKSRAPLYVAMRQALCYYLYESGVPCDIIYKAMHYTRSNVYNGINQARNMLEVGDKIMQAGYEELNNHKIRVVACTADGAVLSRFVGYRLVIDNVIY